MAMKKRVSVESVESKMKHSTADIEGIHIAPKVEGQVLLGPDDGWRPEDPGEMYESLCLLVIDRFTAWCFKCKEHMNSSTKKCPRCGIEFKQVTTSYTCGWMRCAAREARKDLTFIEPQYVPGLKLYV